MPNRVVKKDVIPAVMAEPCFAWTAGIQTRSQKYDGRVMPGRQGR